MDPLYKSVFLTYNSWNMGSIDSSRIPGRVREPHEFSKYDFWNLWKNWDRNMKPDYVRQRSRYVATENLHRAQETRCSKSKKISRARKYCSASGKKILT